MESWRNSAQGRYNWWGHIKYNYSVLTALRWLAANTLPKELLESDIPLEQAKELFSYYVRIVEVENHSYCNRTCWFCPNSSIDRRSKNILMGQDIFHKILSDLASINYNQSFVFCGYCESLSDESIFTNVALARKMLPKAYIKIYSNGDYLNSESIHRLEKVGLDQVRLSLYPSSDDPQEHAELLKALSKRTGLKVIEGNSRYRGLQLEGSSLLLPIEVKHFRPGHISTRGGYLAKENGTDASFVRTAICFEPLKHLAINYNGKCMLCCQLRSDIALHKEGIIGDLSRKDYSLFHYYRDLALARKMLLKSGPKTGICGNCEHNYWGAGPYKAGRHPVIAGIFNSIPLMNTVINKTAIFPRNSHKRYANF